MNINVVRGHVLLITAILSLALARSVYAQDDTLGVGNWFTVSSNLDAGYRRTQLFTPHYNTGVFQWDSRVELWLPPFRDKFSWGPYLRVAGIKGSESDWFQNAWLGGPGFGVQVYPLSSWRFQGPDSKVGRVLGPLRFFGEYNFVDYWGVSNQWRPRNQARVGFDYWKAVNVNEPGRNWWAEIWNGLYWQSTNDFTDRYDSVIFANSVRVGIRKPRSGALSTISPYLAVESSRTKYDYDGPTRDFYWENHLLAGGGLRFAPSLAGLAKNNRGWLTRFVIYGEYMSTATYYGPTAPPSAPRFDVRVGVSANVGRWYK